MEMNRNAGLCCSVLDKRRRSGLQTGFQRELPEHDPYLCLQPVMAHGELLEALPSGAAVS